MTKRWIDITQPFQNTIATWPGDTPFHFELAFTKEQTGSVNIGRFTTSTHTGTHADAPYHFDVDAPTIEQMDVNIYIGEALVIDLSEIMEIRRGDLEEINFYGVSRVLFKLHSKVDTQRFPNRVPMIHPEIAPFLSEKGIRLIGVDCPSVDALESKSLDTHHALYRHGIHIIENLMLEQVLPGLYDFIGIPLKIVGADGAPVRAVIRKIEDEGGILDI